MTEIFDNALRNFDKYIKITQPFQKEFINRFRLFLDKKIKKVALVSELSNTGKYVVMISQGKNRYIVLDLFGVLSDITEKRSFIYNNENDEFRVAELKVKISPAHEKLFNNFLNL